jgi:hypothetical protein
MRLTGPQIAAYASAAGFPSGELTTAVAVALAESGGDTNAKGDVSLQSATWGPSVGVWQIRSLTAAALARETNAVDKLRVAGKLTDPAYNAHVAHAIWASRGWGPWSTYPLASTRYLPQARAAVKAPAAIGSGSKSAGTTASGSGSLPDGGAVVPVSYSGGGSVEQIGYLGDVGGELKSLVLPLNLLSGGMSITDAASNAVSLLAQLVAFIAKAAVWLSNPANWFRIVKVWGGTWLVLVGTVMFGWPVLAPVAKVAAQVVPAGKVATLAGAKAAGSKAAAAGATAKAAPKAAPKAAAKPAKSTAAPAARPKVATA